MKPTNHIYKWHWTAAFGLPFAILLLLVALACSAFGQTNTPPPLPTPDELNALNVYTTTDSAVGFAQEMTPPPLPGDAVESTNTIELPHWSPPPAPREPRRIMRADRTVAIVSPDEINWYFSSPLYKVEHCATLGDPWKTIAIVDGTNFAHRHAEGFYRIKQIQRPSLPPTLPPTDMPTNIPSAASASLRETTPATKQPSGFFRRAEP